MTPKRSWSALPAVPAGATSGVDMVPRPESGRQVGPAYTSRLIEYTQGPWRPNVATQHADSLQRLCKRLAELMDRCKDDDPSQKTHRSRPPPRRHQHRLGAGKIDPPRPPEHAAPVVGAPAAGRGAGGDLQPDGGRSVRAHGAPAQRPCKKRGHAGTRQAARRLEQTPGRRWGGAHRGSRRRPTPARSLRSTNASPTSSGSGCSRSSGSSCCGRTRPTRRCSSRRATRSGRAGAIPARRTPTTRAPGSCSTATSCPRSTIPLPAAVRCRWRRSGWASKPTPAT